jgi:membrane-bound serine protease (ClpP class)
VKPRRLRAALLVAAMISGAMAAPAFGAPRVLHLTLEGPISPISDDVLRSAIHRAERDSFSALVIQIDTPGGLESSMRSMVKRMLASEVPIVAWVAPDGSRAASAGVFIVMAADVASMAPGTNIGAATPINLQGPMDSTLARKAANDAAAFARTVAAQRGRNAAWAEDAVRHAVSASETEAVDLHIVDFLAASLPELLEKSSGRTWRRHGETRTLELRAAKVTPVNPDFRHRLLSVIADPNVAYILLMLGFYGLLFELQNPGALLPGVVGGICLILALFALSALSVNYAGIALLVLALVFFVAEIKVQSHGLLGAGGVIAMLLGSLILFERGAAGVSIGLVLGATAATALFFTLVVGAGIRAQRSRVRTGRLGLVGQRGIVLERLAPAGRIRIGDELWNARSERELEIGETVEVVGVEGLTLAVRPHTREVKP